MIDNVLTAEQEATAREIAYNARGFEDCVRKTLAHFGWREDPIAGTLLFEKRVSPFCAEPFAITESVLRYLDPSQAQYLGEYLYRAGHPEAVPMMLRAWQLLPAIVQRGGHRSATEMEAEVLRLLETPRGCFPPPREMTGADMACVHAECQQAGREMRELTAPMVAPEKGRAR